MGYPNSHYGKSILFGLVVAIITIIFQNIILDVLKNNNILDIFFIYSVTLGGFILTSYGIFFGILPSLDSSLKKSDTFKKINKFFYVCLIVILIQIVSSLIFIFYNNTIILVLNFFLLGTTLIMFLYIITGIQSLFRIISKD